VRPTAPHRTRVIIVDADTEQARALSRGLSRARPDITVSTPNTTSAAKLMMTEHAVDLLLLGLRPPDAQGIELVTWAHERCPETAIFTMAARGLSEAQQERLNGSVTQHFEEPVSEQELVTRLCDALNQSISGYLENISLASFLQLLEMERKSCTLHVRFGEQEGMLAVAKGRLVGARTAELDGEDAAICIVSWPEASISISKRRAPAGAEIQSSLGFILIEAMRLVDEAARGRGRGEGSSSAWPGARRSRRPKQLKPGPSSPSQAPPGEVGLPSGASALALVETSTGNVLRSACREDCPIGELARLAAQLLLQEAATLQLCGEGEGVEELVLSTTSRCDVIRPLSQNEFALLIFAPEETNLVFARLELDHFIASEQASRSDG
jgi:DNA-binding response OmpR family regulator